MGVLGGHAVQLERREKTEHGARALDGHLRQGRLLARDIVMRRVDATAQPKELTALNHSRNRHPAASLRLKVTAPQESLGTWSWEVSGYRHDDEYYIQ